MIGCSLDVSTLEDMLPLVETLVECGAEGFMLKPRIDQINDDLIALSLAIWRGFGKPVFFHPFERDINGNWYVANDTEHMKKLVKAYTFLFKAIRDNSFYPLFIFHGGRLRADGTQINGQDKVSVASAMDGTVDFIHALQDAKAKVMEKKHGDIALVIENLPGLDRNKREYPVGYSLRQLKELRARRKLGDKPTPDFWDLSYCVDIAHDLISREELEMFASVMRNIRCFHYSGNERKNDDHLLPYREYVGNKRAVEFFLSHPDLAHAAKIIEVSNERFEQTNRRELKRVISSFKGGVIPSMAQAIR